jgi:hypothetical protein
MALWLSLLILCLAVSSSAAEGRWRRAADTGWLVWTASARADFTVAWSGACQNGNASGHGTLFCRHRRDGVWHVSRYVGAMREGKQDGEGVLYYANNECYRGGWLHGKREGHGACWMQAAQRRGRCEMRYDVMLRWLVITHPLLRRAAISESLGV